MRAVPNRSALDPFGRTDERLRAHYELERELADRLRTSTRDERRTLYTDVYEELFTRLPDHPQNMGKRDPVQRRTEVARLAALVRDHLCTGGTFMEIGAGDCELSFEIARDAGHVYAIEVSETIAAALTRPSNFELLITDGCTVPVPPESVDVAFSDQLMEHLHPDDAEEQVRGIFRALAPGGVYICLTPNRLIGPGDISAFFDDDATGFHLREYTTTDLDQLFRMAGFARVRVVARRRNLRLTVPAAPFRALEWLLERLPRNLRSKSVVRKLVSPGGGVIAIKAH